VTAARAANLGLKFLLELCMLAALAYWGAQAAGSTAGDVLLAVAAPLAAAVVWGAFAAPRAPRRLQRGPRLALELGVFAVAAVALAAAGATVLAVVFAGAVVVNAALLAALGDLDA
jgi:Protein of unknown function (DUF2568)